MTRKHDPYRFTREQDGSVRLRIRFTSDEADGIERAASGPILEWVHGTLHEAVRNANDANGRQQR